MDEIEGMFSLLPGGISPMKHGNAENIIKHMMIMGQNEKLEHGEYCFNAY